MQINVADINVVGETEATIFETLGQGQTDSLVFLSNLGGNTVNYRFQQLTGGSWVNLVANPDGDLYGTLMATETRSIKLSSTNPQIRLVANASGGSSLWFQVSRFAIRGSGGKLPILNL